MGRHRRRAPATRQAGWAVTGTLALGGMQWGVMAVLARVSGPQAVGSYALALGIAAPVFTFSLLQLRVLLVTEARVLDRLGTFLAVRICTSTAALAGLAGGALVVGGRTGLFLAAIALARFFETIGDLFLAVVQAAGHVDVAAQTQTLLAVTSAGLFAAALLATGEVQAAAWSLPLGSLLVALVWPWRRARALVPRDRRMLSSADFRLDRMRDTARIGIPLGVSSCLTALAVAAPRFSLQATHGSHAVGIYAGVAQLVQAVSSVAGAVAQSRLPALAGRFHAEGPAPMARATTAAVGLCASAGLVLAVPGFLCGPAIVTALYGREFVVSPAATATLAVATGLLSAGWFLDQALVTQRRTSAQLGLNAAGLVGTLAGCVLLTGPLGVLGAAIAVTAATFAQCVLKAVVVNLRTAPSRPEPAPARSAA